MSDVITLHLISFPLASTSQRLSRWFSWNSCLQEHSNSTLISCAMCELFDRPNWRIFLSLCSYTDMLTHVLLVIRSEWAVEAEVLNRVLVRLAPIAERWRQTCSVSMTSFVLINARLWTMREAGSRIDRRRRSSSPSSRSSPPSSARSRTAATMSGVTLNESHALLFC